MIKYYDFIHFVCDVLAIDEPKVIFMKGEKIYNQRYQPVTFDYLLKPSAMATSFYKERTIVIDLDKHADDLEYVTLAHEIRHLFQYEAITSDEPDLYESKATIRQWKKDFKGYKDSSFAGYENQAIEVDANAFAFYIIRLVLNRTINVNCDTNKLIERFNIIKNEVSIDEIKECAKYCGIKLKGVN